MTDDFDKAQVVLRDLGRPRLTDILSAIAGTRVGNLLRKDHIRFSSEYRACESEPWRNITEKFHLTPLELAGEAESIVQIIKTKRAATLIEIVNDLEEMFVAKAGPNPTWAFTGDKDWFTVVFEGWWLRETIARDGPNVVVFIDCVLAFVQKSRPSCGS